jgi:hypothetical protein
LSKIVCIFFASASHCSISIALCCASTIVYTSMVCRTFNCIFVDRCYSFKTTFSSLCPFALSMPPQNVSPQLRVPFDSSMHTKSTNVALGPIWFLTHQCHLLLCKNSTTYVSVIFVVNYRLHKLYLLIIRFPFYTF